MHPVLEKAITDGRKSELEILAAQFHEQLSLRDTGATARNTYKAIKILATPEEVVEILENEFRLA